MCRQYLAQLREQYDLIEREGYQVIAVAPSQASFIKQFLDSFGPYPFGIVGDPNKEAFKGVGTITQSRFKLFTKVALGMLTRKLKNVIPKDKQQAEFVKKSMTTQDVFIQGGTFIFDENGKLIWKHIDESPEKHARVRKILEVIKN
ncbi:redoxin domain-containing protein [Filobacillus milosensis]|uniref:Redoxin domain-containing protein n=1 Tax=Filobacillus milosensis TaxID=94137 RepID=A0A4Y8IED8_9BACI|nr:peroxiredoxin-like family protein [Filobacillus milosensis]TFB14596.1 redoxin domain-containing protein [Filobacillus milosensis]